MKKLIPLAVVALVTGCSSAPKDVYLSCMPDKVEITTIAGPDPVKEQGDPKDYDFLLRFNIDEQTANEGSDKYIIDESEGELRFDLENLDFFILLTNAEQLYLANLSNKAGPTHPFMFE